MPEPIITSHVFPPIPFRGNDWTAYRDPEGLVGWGATEAKAIEDLKQQEWEDDTREAAILDNIERNG